MSLRRLRDTCIDCVKSKSKISDIGRQPGPQVTELRDALERIRRSQTFRNTQRVLEFLNFVVTKKLEGREAELRENKIGVALYRRDLDYDTKIDSIVRTQARRVRDRLAEYYGSEGAADPFVICLPKGG